METAAKSIVHKWLSFDPDNHQFGFLIIILGCTLFILPLLGMAIIGSNSGTRVSAQTAPVQTIDNQTTTCGSECATLSVSWTRPSAVAQFVDLKGNTSSCTSSELSCSVVGVFEPNTTVNYTVRVKNAQGAVLSRGTSLVTARKVATANWNWTYAVAIYPSTYSDCLAAGINHECLTKSVSNNDLKNTVVYNDVRAGTEYMIYVCAPNCGEGTAILQTKQTSPVKPACSVEPNSATVGGSVKVTSLGGLTGSIGLVSGLGSPVYSGLGNLPANGSTNLNIPRDVQAGTYVVAVGAFAIGCTPQVALIVPEATPSPGASPTPVVTPSPVACQYDFDNSGQVSQADVKMLLEHFGEAVPSGSNLKVYDVNNDGAIDLADAIVVQKKYGSCPQ